MGLRLHILGIPHTICTNEYSHCAFTGKVLRFPRMLMSRGFEVYHYGIEGSDTGATRHFDILRKDEWQRLRVISLKKMKPELTEEEVNDKLSNPKTFAGELANYSTPLYEEFNRRLRITLMENYRSTSTDIICLPFGRSHNAAIDGLNYVVVESGIGYNNSTRNYRVFESYAWLHETLAREDKWGQNYWFVAPNYFDSTEWKLSLTPTKNKVGFLGRIYDGKGCQIIVEIARRFPHVDFYLCGQGEPNNYLVEKNIHYVEPIHGTQRSDYLGSLCCLISPTKFIEPFCGVSVEAQLCGTPVIAPEYGATTENIEPFKTGILCHTLQDYCVGVQMALDGLFDRTYIRERAVKLYDMYNVAKRYEYIFKTIIDVHNGKNGWYSPDSYIQTLNT
jgi:glycosyltransferase involved in cell wall biosynthesis